ncbi:MAG TPA: FAD-dependent oxidoreductase [Gemmatimonadales bacterium]|nr:FAD-dependent oxidoreductase [Gemmatimonadales bacterium]
MAEPHVAILGGGPAGVGAAYRLRETGKARVTLLEQQPVVGGNAGSFEAGGQRLDYGSHRLHPACDPAILADIRALLGADLLDRPRHGRIHLRGRFVHFPLQPLDLLLRLDPGFALGTVRDLARKAFRRSSPEGESFASVLLANLGPTICHEFYFPYARKIWGRSPDELSGIQARRRVSAGSFAKLVRKIVSAVPGFRPPGSGRFFYPRQGYGQISEAYAAAARARGAELWLGTRVTRLEPPGGPAGRWCVIGEQDGLPRSLEADFVWSTLPLPVLARAVAGVPEEVLQAAARIRYRAMILVYLDLAVDRFTEFDAHYFPDLGIRITRLSEPKRYADRREPVGRTTLCAELPCDAEDETWRLDDAALGRLVAEDLARAGLPLPAPPLAAYTRRLRYAYPIYLRGYERHFATLDAWAESLPHLLTYGRQGLFAHDNTHHALFMAYRAVDCLGPGGFDLDRWRQYREVFATHVVED